MILSLGQLGEKSIKNTKPLGIQNAKKTRLKMSCLCPGGAIKRTYVIFMCWSEMIIV
jgi:hypothetical protein